jgi:hypothetical protein
VGFEVSRRTTLSASQAWARLTDWERHSGLIPMTTVTLVDGPSRGRDARFTARTTLGPFRFDDPMEVTFWRPPTTTTPGLCRIVKRGRVVVGWAVFTVTAAGSGAVVTWREEAHFGFAGPFLNWPTALAGRAVFSRLVDQLLRD